MNEIDLNTPIWQLTVGQFMELQNRSTGEKKYEYGIKGLAKILGCSRTKAAEIKASGIIDEAIVQNGNIIVIDKEKALQLFGKK